MPREVNQKSEQKTVVRYETVEERRQAMIAKGWSPTVLAALEEAMEEAMKPKFLREQKKKEEVKRHCGSGASTQTSSKLLPTSSLRSG